MQHFTDGVWFDETHCKILKDDFKRIDATPSGGLDKTDMNRKDIGHGLDTARYYMCYVHFDDFKNLDLYKKQVKIELSRNEYKNAS